MKYINENPTKTEKILFKKYGLYLIYKDEDSYRYAPIHIENKYVYPSSVEVENDMVEWEHDVLFDIFTETVTIHGNYDSIGITLIHERMKELNFNWFGFFNSTNDLRRNRIYGQKCRYILHKRR